MSGVSERRRGAGGDGVDPRRHRCRHTGGVGPAVTGTTRLVVAVVMATAACGSSSEIATAHHRVERGDVGHSPVVDDHAVPDHDHHDKLPRRRPATTTCRTAGASRTPRWSLARWATGVPQVWPAYPTTRRRSPRAWSSTATWRGRAPGSTASRRCAAPIGRPAASLDSMPLEPGPVRRGVGAGRRPVDPADVAGGDRPGLGPGDAPADGHLRLRGGGLGVCVPHD